MTTTLGSPRLPFTPTISHEHHIYKHEKSPLSLSHLLKPLLQAGAYAKDITASFSLIIHDHVNLEIVDDMAIFNVAHAAVHIKLHENSHITFFGKYEPLTLTELSPDMKKVSRFFIFSFLSKQSTAKAFFSYSGLGDDSFALDSIQYHAAPFTKSEVTLKSVLRNAAQVRCNTLIKIEPECNGVEARQSCKTLLLSNSARAVAIPKLEVESHDVSCSHGAAMSSIDEKALFYLSSRGLSLEQARQMMADYFVAYNL